MEPGTCMTDICYAYAYAYEAMVFIILALMWGFLHYICVRLNDEGSMLILRPELSNLVACEVRETPVALQSIECIQPARLPTSLF